MTETALLRIQRPYATEPELLQQESWTVTKKSIYLIGAESLAEGTLVRCELALSTGAVLLVAEGTVVKHVASAAGRPSGVVVRFRRLSSSGSQFIARACQAREALEHLAPAAHDCPPASRVASELENAPPLTTSVDNGHRPVLSTSGQSVGTPELGDEQIASALDRLGNRGISQVSPLEDRSNALARLRSRTRP